MVDRRTRRSRGFGFVRFANGRQGAAAAEADGERPVSRRIFWQSGGDGEAMGFVIEKAAALGWVLVYIYICI